MHAVPPYVRLDKQPDHQRIAGAGGLRDFTKQLARTVVLACSSYPHADRLRRNIVVPYGLLRVRRMAGPSRERPRALERADGSDGPRVPDYKQILHAPLYSRGDKRVCRWSMQERTMSVSCWFCFG